MSRRYKVINRCIPGTTLERWNKLAPVFVEDEMPTAVIIHCGTNNIHRSLTTECFELLDSIINAVLNVDSSISTLISSLTTQRHTGHSIWIQEFNARLRDMCSLRSWTYIDNSNTRLAHLNLNDGLHLGRKGTSLLAQNFIASIKCIQPRSQQVDFINGGNRTVK